MRDSGHSWSEKSSGEVVKPLALNIVEEGRRKGRSASTRARGPLGVSTLILGVTILGFQIPGGTEEANGGCAFFINDSDLHYTHSDFHNL